MAQRVEREQAPLALDRPAEAADRLPILVTVEPEAFGVEARDEAQAGADQEVDALVERGARVRIVPAEVLRAGKGEILVRQDSRVPRRHRGPPRHQLGRVDGGGAIGPIVALFTHRHGRGERLAGRPEDHGGAHQNTQPIAPPMPRRAPACSALRPLI